MGGRGGGFRVAVRVLAAALLGSASPAVGAFPAPDTSAEPVEPTAVEWLSDRLVDLSFTNPRVPYHPTKVRFLVPAGWRQAWEADPDWVSSVERVPVVFLLHGGGDRYDGWTEKHDGWPVSLEEFTADKDVVVVMPDGGTYVDHHNDGEYGPPEWTTWHIGQLVPWVKANLPVRQDRGGWVVSGLSWGGFGTMSYLARHPDLFAGGFAYSGALDLRPIGNVDSTAFGNEVEQEVRFRGHNPTNLVDNMRDALAIWFRTGQGVPGGPAPLDDHPAGMALEVGCWYTNESFRLALDQEGLDYTYDPYPMGAHNWWHWHDGFQNHAWPAMAELFARTDIPDVPDDFHYRSIQPEFDIYGWNVRVDRDVVEFLTLDDVSPEGFTVTGSGSVEVHTPPAYEPGATYVLDVTGSDTADAPVGVVADDRGRLHLPITLGPSHEYQQYTAAQLAAEAADPDYWQTATITIAGPRGAVIQRVAGADRAETAAAVSAIRYTRADTVVLANAEQYPDALAGAPLAAELRAPLLLTDGDQLTPATAAEIDWLGASEAVLLGREEAISRAVEAELIARGTRPRRVGGADRWETAVEIANELETVSLSAIVVEGAHEDPQRGWPDALSAAPYAAFTGQPILLTLRDRLPAATAQALEDLEITETIVIGGETVAAGMDPDHLWVATGLDFPDALAAGPAVGAHEHTMLLVHGGELSRSAATEHLLAARAAHRPAVRILGGVGAVSRRVERELEAALR